MFRERRGGLRVRFKQLDIFCIHVTILSGSPKERQKMDTKGKWKLVHSGEGGGYAEDCDTEKAARDLHRELMRTSRGRLSSALIYKPDGGVIRLPVT
jgi:hypothetical protein